VKYDRRMRARWWWCGLAGAMVGLTRDASGVLHLTYITPSTPSQLRYAHTE